MTMTEKEFELFMLSHPELTLDEKMGIAKLTKKKTKYFNTKVYEDETGFASSEKGQLKGKLVATYDSIKEYNRWKELLLLERTGQIQNLKRQQKLIIQEKFIYNGENIKEINYKADFCYIKNGKEYIEDVKAFDKTKGKYLTTKDFDLKWKLLKYKYPEKMFVLF